MKRFFFILFLFFFTVKIFESFYPLANGDPFYYHLVFPIKVFEIGWVQTHKNLCGALQTGLMEYIYILPYLIFSNHLIKYQQFSQFIHFALGLGLGSFTTFYLLKNKNYVLALLAAISLLTISRSSDFFLLAKNDGLIPTLTLVATYCLINQANERRMNYKDGVILFCLSLIPLIKLNGLIVNLVLNLYFILKNYKHFKKIIIYGATQLFFLSIVLFRNWYFIKSPFFPGMLKLFPGQASPEMIYTYTQFMSNPSNFASVIQNLINFFSGKIIYTLAIPFFIINLFRKKSKPNTYIALSFSMFLVYLKINGGITTERLYFFCYFLTNFFIFYSLAQYDLTKWKYFALLAIVLMDSKIDKSLMRIKNLISLEKLEYTTYVKRISHRNTIWEIVKKDHEDLRIITDAWNEIFYAPPRTQLDCTECLPQGYFLKHCSSESDLNRINYYHYAILSKKENNKCYNLIRMKKFKVGQVENFEVYKI